MKSALPYVLLAAMAAWSLSLQKEMAQLETENAALAASVSELSSSTKRHDKAVVEWVEAHDAETARLERLNDELDKVDDCCWGDARLPDEYVRVLREAGIFAEGGNAPGHTVSGGGNPEAVWNDEQGAARVCPRGGSSR